MTVKELMKVLAQHPPDAQVYLDLTIIDPLEQKEARVSVEKPRAPEPVQLKLPFD